MIIRINLRLVLIFVAILWLVNVGAKGGSLIFANMSPHFVPIDCSRLPRRRVQNPQCLPRMYHMMRESRLHHL